MENKKFLHKTQIFILVLIASIFMSFLPDMSAYASESKKYYSWMREGEDDVYSNVGTAGDTSTYETYQPKDDSVVKHLVNLINTGSYAVDKWLYKALMPNYSLNMSGIVMGRLADYNVSILKFELFKDNPWGLVGAIIYTTFRNVIYGLMFLYCAMLLGKQLFAGGAKGRAELKSTFSTVIFLFSLLYIMPWVVNMFIIIRDSFILNLGEAMLGTRGLDINESISAVMHMSDEVDLFLALVYFALMIAPIFYIVGYASIAMQETGLFGLFPVIALLSIRDKKLLNSWSGMFFSNLAVPLLDYVFLLIPIILKLLINPTAGESVSYAIVTLCCIWSAQPARNAILRLFGNMGGAQANIGGMAALGMMAMRMMGGGAKGGSGLGGGAASVTDDLTNAQRFENLAGGFNEALADTQREVDKIATVDDVLHGTADENGMVLTSLADGTVEGNGAGIDTSDVELGTGDGNMNATMEGEAGLSSESVQADTNGEALSEEGLPLETGIENGAMPEEMPLEAPEDNNAFYTRGEIPSEELSQRQVFQNARLDNLEKLDAAKEAMNDQQAAVDAAEKHYASVSGDVSAKQALYDKNNARLGEIETKLTNENAYIQKYNEQKSAYPTMSPAEKQSFDSQFANIEERRTRIGNLTNEQATLTAQNATLSKEISAIKSNPEYTRASQAVTDAKGKRDALSAVIQKRTDAEQAYATMMESQGGSGKVYDNATAYKNRIKANEIANKQTSWRNFDAHADTSDISPDEKARYYREKAEHKQNQAMVRSAAKVAGGFAGAVAGMYGGVGAMATGAMLGSSVTGGAANKGMEHYHDRKDLKQAENAPTAVNKYEQYVKNRKEGRVPQPQNQPVKKQSSQKNVPIDGLRESIREEVISNAEKAGFSTKKN